MLGLGEESTVAHRLSWCLRCGKQAGRKIHSAVAPTVDSSRSDLTFKKKKIPIVALAEEMEAQHNSNFKAGKL